MPLNSNAINYIIGDDQILENMMSTPAWTSFDIKIIQYLDTVSKLLLSDTEAKQYPDVITFAFWCRKASLINMQKTYGQEVNRIGRGVAFHIAPSNVAVNFAYSLVVGMISGNANIVRIPSKEYPQVNIICSTLKMALTEEMKPYICLLKYGHDKDITDYLSYLCDTRIIWGGDETIMTVRKSPLRPRSTEITFADRYSICIINSEEYLNEENKQNIARGFYNDTYLSDQNACTSPRIVVWMGNGVKEAQNMFWNELHQIVEKEYTLQPVQAVSKYTNMCKHAAAGDKIQKINDRDNYIDRIGVTTLNEGTMQYKGNSGYFMEYEAQALEELLPLCDTQCQTLSYYGMIADVIKEFIMSARPRGVDRIVPIGKTMDFSLIWDGYDLIDCLTRKVFSN